MNVTQLTQQRKANSTHKTLPKAAVSETKPETTAASEPTDKVESGDKLSLSGLSIPGVPEALLTGDPVTIAATIGGMFAWAVAKKLIGVLAEGAGDLIVKILKGKGKGKKKKKAEKAAEAHSQTAKLAVQSIPTQSGQSQEVATRGSVNAPQTMAILT